MIKPLIRVQLNPSQIILEVTKRPHACSHACANLKRIQTLAENVYNLHPLKRKCDFLQMY